MIEQIERFYEKSKKNLRESGFNGEWALVFAYYGSFVEKNILLRSFPVPIDDKSEFVKRALADIESEELSFIYFVGSDESINDPNKDLYIAWLKDHQAAKQDIEFYAPGYRDLLK